MDRTVLVIEDNDQNRYLVTFLLERHGLRVVSEPDGPRGIDTARSLRPDLILLDIQLPVMNGYQVARELRRLPDFADVLDERVWVVSIPRGPSGSETTLRP